jgi:type IV pilus assembly protein PilM
MAALSKQYKLGLDIGSSSIKLCVPHRGGKPLVLRLPTPQGAVNKGVLQNAEAVADFLRQQLRNKQLVNNQVVSTLPASTLVLRHIQLPRLKAKDLPEAIHWEAKRVLPFPLEEAQLDWLVQDTVISEEGEMQDILLVAVRDSLIDRYVQAINDAGLKLVALDVAPLALGRWLLKSAEGASLIIDIGAETTQIHFFNDTHLIFSRSVSVGGVEATRAIASVSGQSYAEAEAIKIKGEYPEGWLDSWIRELGREIERSLEYYRTNFEQGADGQYQRVYLSGGAALTRGVNSMIRQIAGVEVGFAEFSSKDRTPRQDKIMYNVALGAGMWEGK